MNNRNDWVDGRGLSTAEVTNQILKPFLTARVQEMINMLKFTRCGIYYKNGLYISAWWPQTSHGSLSDLPGVLASHYGRLIVCTLLWIVCFSVTATKKMCWRLLTVCRTCWPQPAMTVKSSCGTWCLAISSVTCVLHPQKATLTSPVSGCIVFVRFKGGGRRGGYEGRNRGSWHTPDPQF